MGGPGQGQGGVAPEDESQVTGFHPEKVRTALRAGKMLLEIQEKGEGLPTEVSGSYSNGVEEVRRGVSEAILHERIPPDYHEAIQRYFDTLPKSAAEKAKPAGEAGASNSGASNSGASNSGASKSGNDRP